MKKRLFQVILIPFLLIMILSINELSKTGTIFNSIIIFIEIFLTGSYSIDLTNRDQPILIIAAVAGILFEIVLLIVFITLGLRYLLTRDLKIKELLTSFNLPFRYIYLGFFTSISVLSTIVFKIVEDVSWLDAIYFVIATISTVGYGDVVAHYRITKIIAILLIINGISFLGIASQFLVDRIIKLQIETQSLPNKPLDYENHIIIGGFGAKGRKLARLFIDRKYKVIVVDKDPERIKSTISNIKFINGDITKPGILKLLSLDKAAGLFLILSDDNTTIQSSIIARNISPQVDIYAELSAIPTYKISAYAGINRPISLYHFLLNVIRANLRQKDMILLENEKAMKTHESKLGYVIVPIGYDYNQHFENVFEIAYVNLNLDEISVFYHPLALDNLEQFEIYKSETMKQKTHILIGIDKEELLQEKKLELVRESGKFSHKRIIFAGYPVFADEFLERIDLGPENTIILWQNENERQNLQNKEYQSYEWNIDTGISLLEGLIREEDLVICSFDDITSAMIVAVTLRNMEIETHLVQVVPYEYDVEPLIQIGAEAVVTPQKVISDALLSTFIDKNYLSPSFVFNNGHIYEHLCQENDPFYNKKVSEIYDSGSSVLFINKKGDKTFREAFWNDKVFDSDRILIYVRHS